MDNKLTDEEKNEIRHLLDNDCPLPDKYRWRLFREPQDFELIWPGKSRAECDVAQPLQTIERVDGTCHTSHENEPHPLFAELRRPHQPDGWKNQLIWGDNKRVLASLVDGPLRQQIEGQGGVKLIYVDPPFDVGTDFAMNVEIGGQNGNRRRNRIEAVAYRDVWGTAADSFLAMMYERLLWMHRLLADDGSIYVHCDNRANSHLRLLMDEIFGRSNFRNQISWCYRGGGVPKRDFAPKHDTILRYSKTDNYIFNVDAVRIPYSEDVLRSDASRYDKSYRGESVYEGYKPNEKGKHPEDWWTIQPLMPSDKTERLAYPTQKPVELIQRIIDASSNPGDLVADFFCGSGTSLAVAEGLRVRRKRGNSGKEKLEYYFAPSRKWIGSDLSQLAIQTARKRLIELRRQAAGQGGADARPFEIAKIEPPDQTPHHRQHPIVPDPRPESPAVEIKTHVRPAKTGADSLAMIAVELTGYSVPLSSERVQTALRSKHGSVVIENGELIRETKAAEGQIHREKLLETWSDWIDYWAVDFCYGGEHAHAPPTNESNETPAAEHPSGRNPFVFDNRWQSFRTRRERRLELTSGYVPCEPGRRRLAVCVVDILGNETMTVVDIDV